MTTSDQTILQQISALADEYNIEEYAKKYKNSNLADQDAAALLLNNKIIKSQNQMSDLIGQLSPETRQALMAQQVKIISELNKEKKISNYTFTIIGKTDQ